MKTRFVLSEKNQCLWALPTHNECLWAPERSVLSEKERTTSKSSLYFSLCPWLCIFASGTRKSLRSLVRYKESIPEKQHVCVHSLLSRTRQGNGRPAIVLYHGKWHCQRRLQKSVLYFMHVSSSSRQLSVWESLCIMPSTLVLTQNLIELS